MAHLRGFASPDAPADQSAWSRGEDLQGIMGPPAPLPIAPFIDSPRSGVGPNLSHSPCLYSNSRLPEAPGRLPVPSPPSWSSYSHGSRPSNAPDFRAFTSCLRATDQDEDAWNPLQITGLPPLRRVNNNQRNQISRTPASVPNETSSPISALSQDSHNFTSELASQVNGHFPSDSGYATRSVSTKSHAGSIPMDCRENDSIFSKNTTTARPQYRPASYSNLPTNEPRDGQNRRRPSVARPDDPPEQQQEQICDIPNCKWTGRCPSDKKKHMLRHEKPFRCEEVGCSRRLRGFGTKNDLTRHKRSVHGIEVSMSKVYKCFAENCSRKDQIWPRQDNFRQHIQRIHINENMEELLRRSDEWYETTRKQQQQQQQQQHEGPSGLPPQDHDSFNEITRYPSSMDSQTVQPATIYHGSSSVLPLSMTVRPGDAEIASTVMSTEYDFRTEQNGDHDGQQGIGTNNGPKDERSISQSEVTNPTSALPYDIQLRDLELPGMESVMASAMGLLKALEKEMENAQCCKQDAGCRTSSGLCTHQPDPSAISPHTPSFLDLLRVSGNEERKVVQEVMRAGLKHLGAQTFSPWDGRSESHETFESNDQQDSRQNSFSCPFEGCKKRPQGVSGLNKHISRHVKPYGCTYNNCSKKFGSKNDWKKHENTKHFRHQSWHCQEKTPGRLGDVSIKCGKIFRRRIPFQEHLRTAHGILADNEIKESVRRSLFGRNGQVKFWCGFCKKPIRLASQGMKAWDERFDHIDDKHLKQGEDIEDWAAPPNDDVLKDPAENKGVTEGISKCVGKDDIACRGEEENNGDFQVLENPASLFSSFIPLTQPVSFERGPPAKRLRTTHSRAVSPMPPSSEHHKRPGSAGESTRAQPQPQSSNPATGSAPIHQPEGLPPRRWEFNPTVANSLYFVSNATPRGKPTFITCCDCEAGPKYSTSLSPHCTVCLHKPCLRCRKHWDAGSERQI